ncbi:DUF4405 domain-containing protein [Maritalea mobilis]|uniref:DUF4405 domain-containing protein n=1 Tax=Maritalea mobilis TaxID=483324 RepID=UPI001C965E0D|nr:DUF4405 domain-containing protein [Maritalea mobilis]MBY6201334.1 DUF4405 domain-containing protein [Maritalea mobilis]
MDRANHAQRRKKTPHPSRRSSAVFAAGLSFVGMAASGLILFVQPRAMFGSGLAWSFLGIDIAAWYRVHFVFSLLFVLAGLWHILLHFSVIRTLVFGVAGQSRGHWLEGGVFLALFVIFLVTSILDVPPAAWVTQLHHYMGRGFWQP